MPYSLASSAYPPTQTTGRSWESIHSAAIDALLAGEDTIKIFLKAMPTPEEDPVKHGMWSELIKLKTKTIELQIAEARKREKESELELERIRMATSDTRSVPSVPASGTIPTPTQVMSAGMSNMPMMQPQSVSSTGSAHAGPSAIAHLPLGMTEDDPRPLTPMDLEAMLHSSNVENLDSHFSWLPEFPDPYASHGEASGTINPAMTTLPQQPFQTKREDTESTRNRSPSPDGLHSPPNKKTKLKPDKKVVIDHVTSCVRCGRGLGKVMLRAPKAQIPEPVQIRLLCISCAPIEIPTTLPDQHGAGSHIGTVETRKRVRAAVEIEDEGLEIARRRVWCDVCQRVTGAGQVIGGTGEDLGYMLEVVCSACDSKYQRCTDCGGGGGPRVGIGKWRMRQVFQPGRKTCSLSHSRIGDRPIEIGVHITPSDFTPEQLKEVLHRCRTLWNEKTLARLAVPEMLEIDLPPGTVNPLRRFEDIENIIQGNWPARERMILAEGADPKRFRRFLSLVWAHSRPRRSVRTVDLEEEWHKAPEADDDDDLSTVIPNVKKTNVVIPPGTELIGMWGGEWDMQQGSFLISTFIPFESADGEDNVALSVGEMITRAQTLREKLNEERASVARRDRRDLPPLRQVEHLWVVSGSYMPLVRERIADILVRKRSFVHVEEYLTRHPDFIEAIKARPYGMHPDLQPTDRSGPAGRNMPEPLILVRWLGTNFDPQRVLEIKQAEFGGKGKLKRKPKSRA